LCVRLVFLDAVWQPYRDEQRLAADRAHARHGQLAETAGGGRVDAAADPEHIPPGCCFRELLHQEPDTALDLGAGIELGGHAEFGNDQLLPIPPSVVAHTASSDSALCPTSSPCLHLAERLRDTYPSLLESALDRD
jgi:hypothetical protein